MDPLDFVHAISESPFFNGLEPDEKIILAKEGRMVGHSDGEVLFRPHETPNQLYLVLDGLVEICHEDDPGTGFEPVAYVGPGGTLGESKVVTGTAWRSMARFPEGGATLQWPRPFILRRLGRSHHFSMHYLHNMARRLEGTLSNLAREKSKLEGNLDHFDLSTILQTIIDSSTTGVLEIIDTQGNKFGAVYCDKRLVGPILCGPLAGGEAFLEIFVNPPDQGRFCFTPQAEARGTNEYHQLQHLVLDAARLADEFHRFRAQVPPQMELKAVSADPSWQVEKDGGLKKRIWQVVTARPVGWGLLATQLPFSTASVALAVRDMLVKGNLTGDGLRPEAATWLAKGL